MLVHNHTEILAIDFVTRDSQFIIPSLKIEVLEDYLGKGMDFDTVNGKIYFLNQTNIYRANYDGSDKELVVENVDSYAQLAIDWIRRRIYFCDNPLDRIYVATLNGKSKRVLAYTERVRLIALDPVVGYAFLYFLQYMLLRQTDLTRIIHV